MALDNYRDLSVGGSDVGSGFQYEFFCSNCNRRWKSPFKPYRMGQLTGLLTRFAFLFTDLQKAGRTANNVADMGSRGAREKAFAEALARAQTMYTECPRCKKAVCDDCLDRRQNACLPCLGAEREANDLASRRQADDAGSAAQSACPNCRQPHQGGRFCAECGFDMASTHKSCPGCGTMLQRQARFCTDCGHGF